MDLRNVALYCKNWYQTTGDKEQRWKDLAICIANDGWVIRETKREVVSWILMNIDDNYEWFKKAYSRFGLAWFMGEVESHIHWDKWNNNPEGIDYDDAIILVYKSMLSVSEAKLFDKKYYPDSRVLPINLDGPEIKEGEYWKPGEMMSEFIERMHDKYPDHLEQTFEYSIWNRERFEEEIMKK